MSPFENRLPPFHPTAESTRAMDHPYSSFHECAFIPWSNEAMAEPALSDGLQAEARAYGSTRSQPSASNYQFNEDIEEISKYHGNPTAHTAFHAAKNSTTCHGHTQHSQSSMCLDQPLLYSAPETNNFTDMSYWDPVTPSSESVSPVVTVPTSGLVLSRTVLSNLATQHIPNTDWTCTATNHGVSSYNFDTYTSDLRSLQTSRANDGIHIGQRSGQRQIVNEATDNDDTAVRIGSVLSNRRFACDDENCAGQTFARIAELRRHHTTQHAADKPDFWCHVLICSCSVSGGAEAFHRRDKLAAHVKSMHS